MPEKYAYQEGRRGVQHRMIIDFIPWIFMILTITGTLLAIHKKWWCFMIFAATNVWWIIYDYRLGAYPQMAVFVGYCFINLYGARKWLKEYRAKSEEQKIIKDRLIEDRSYKLLKDLPNLKAGRVLSYDPVSNFYVYVNKKGNFVGYPPSVVEVNKNWFKPINNEGGESWWNT